MSQVQTRYCGLLVDGDVEYDPGQPYPSYGCGGSPPSWDVGVTDIDIDDADEFLGTGIIYDMGEHRGWSDGVISMVEALIRITGTMPVIVRRYVAAAWESEIEGALLDRCGA